MNGRPGPPLRVLAVNAGSTSMKLDLVEDGRAVAEFDTLDDALAQAPTVDVVAHRIVHGGRRTDAVIVDDDIVRELTALVDLAPLHQPKALDALASSRKVFPDAVHVACFDTAFHTTIPECAANYALPERLRRMVRVYGFHGLAHEWASRSVTQLVPEARRIVVAHLGGGQSLCAVLDGRSIATTMGFTPLDGLVMATRPGRVDPGAVLWLVAHTEEPLDDVFEHESGLLGLCGTDDFRTVLDRAERGDHDATFALDVMRHRLVTEMGAMVAALRGVDAIAFSGGIGEHATWVHTAVADAFAWIGVVIDARGHDDAAVADGEAGGDVHELTAPGAAVRTFVVRAGEARMMADHARRVVANA
jgi:acetate kinase